MKSAPYIGILLFLFSLFPSPEASAAGCRNRLGLGAGIVHLDSPSETDFEVGAEYECRLDAFVGWGGFVDYIFSSPGIVFLGVPQFYLHPFGGAFYVAASPLLETGSAVGTHLGARLSALLPIPLGLVVLVPSFAVDFVNGGRLYWFGIGLEI